MLKTVLFDRHRLLGAHMVDFAGFSMPVRYSSIIEEHRAVRERAGLFDVSHMGEIRIRGEGAFAFLQHLATNNMEKLHDGKVLYTPLCLESGGVLDDVLLFRNNPLDYLMVVNAGNTDKVFRWMEKQHRTFEDVRVSNISASNALLALQGPVSPDIMKSAGFEIDGLKYYHFLECEGPSGESCLVSRTGYTGENGFEIMIPSEAAPLLWDLLLEKGKSFGILPVGLGARDTLRLEVCFPLYGHELDESTTPIESGIGWAVDLNKSDFIGKSSLSDRPPRRKRIGFETVDRGIPRRHAPLFHTGKPVGSVTSGSFLPFLSKSMGLALVENTVPSKDAMLEMEIRNRRIRVRTVSLPFYTPFNRRNK
jgi:aminomethyltransferase